MSNYVYYGINRAGIENGGQIPGQSSPVIWAATLFKRRWKSLTIKYEGEQVGGICDDEHGHRTYWGESTPRVRIGLPTSASQVNPSVKGN